MLKQQSAFAHAPHEGGLTVILQGDIDHHSAVAVRAEIDDLLSRSRPDCLWLDLSQVDFMDSSGLGLILGRYNTMQRLGGRLVLVSPGKRVEKILALAGIERLIPIEYPETTKTGGSH